MLIDKLPRGTLVARLSCLDLLSRAAKEPHSSDKELQKVAGVVVKYLLDLDFSIEQEELVAYQNCINRMFC